MRTSLFAAAILAALSFGAMHFVRADDDAPASETTTKETVKKESEKPAELKAKKSKTEGSVTIGGQRVDYTAQAGTILLTDKKDKPTASIFYAAYFTQRRRPGPASVDVHLQRRSWLLDDLAAHGRVRAQARRHRRRCSTRRPRRTVSSTTNTACSMSPIWSSSMRRARAFRRSPTRRKGRRITSASIRTRTRSPISSASSCRSTAAGIHRNICSAKATARRARQSLPISCRTIARSISTASCCCRRYSISAC